MSAFTINNYLQSYETVIQLAERLRASIHADMPRNSVSRFVKYMSVDNEPLSFRADVLHVTVIARFELAKYEMPDGDMLSGQFVFFRQNGQAEDRLPITLRIVPPKHVVLPAGQAIELASYTPEDGVEDHSSIQVREAVSVALLDYIIDNLEKWSFKR